MERIIGRYKGKDKGPMLICFGGMHGNEPAGLQALQILHRMLEMEPLVNPDFQFKGQILSLRGNISAINEGKRFIDKDLNRQWTPENIKRVKSSPLNQLDSEDREQKEIIELIEKELDNYQPDKVVVLDLHTTTADGGIFVISSDDPESTQIGINMHAPVIQGMLDGIFGTTLHYFNKENFDYNMVGITFEAGQHLDPISVNRSIAAIVNCMRSIGNVLYNDVEHRHDELLKEYSKNLPNVAHLIMCHRIAPEDQFVMKPGYRNFQAVKKGEILANDKNGPIKAVKDGLILMPLYQNQGEDGFFLIEEMEGY